MATSALDADLRFAIQNKRLITISYDGRIRLVEPHDYGIRAGEAALLAYQVKGTGRDGKPATGWRSLKLSRIQDCRVTDQTFPGSRGHESRAHMKWDQLFARVE